MTGATAHASKPTLVLIHGWGMSPASWDQLADELGKVFDVRCPALPGHGGTRPQPGWTAETLAAEWLDQFPDAVWAGWSLGAQVALAAAQLAGERPDGVGVRGLVMIAATPRFVASEDWSCAMPQKQFRAFKQHLARSPGATMEQFLGLQVLGSRGARRTLSRLQASQAVSDAPDPSSLQTALDVLEHSDLRPALSLIECPVLWICGEEDQLVPAAAARESDRKLSQSRLECVPGAGHAPFISHAAQVLDLVNTWYSEELS